MTSELTKKCNHCAKVFDHEDRWGTTQASLGWGYNSSGKDGDHDQWDLCKACTESLIKIHPLTCAVCRKTIPEVMAELFARNPHSSLYGDYPAALEHLKTSNHCGEEYALIQDRVICELCYEKIIEKFKMPLKLSNDLIVNGDEINRPNRSNRTEDGLKIQEGGRGDSLREIYEAIVSYEEILKIRQDLNKNKLFIRILVSIYREDYRKRFPDEVNLTTGDNRYYTIPLNQLIKEYGALDFTKPVIKDSGQTIAFGNFDIDAAVIFKNFKERLNTEV